MQKPVEYPNKYGTIVPTIYEKSGFVADFSGKLLLTWYNNIEILNLTGMFLLASFERRKNFWAVKT